MAQQPKNFLKRNPVDVLLIEGNERDPNGSLLGNMIERTPEAQRPRVIVVTSPLAAFLFSKEIRKT